MGIFTFIDRNFKIEEYRREQRSKEDLACWILQSAKPPVPECTFTPQVARRTRQKTQESREQQSGQKIFFIKETEPEQIENIIISDLDESMKPVEAEEDS